MNTRVPEFVLFGDSLTQWGFNEITEGFGLFLEKQYRGKARMVNEGRAGFTSANIKSDFDRIIHRATSPDARRTLLFTIFLGANDACIMGETEYVPLPQFEANIREFVETIMMQNAMSDTKIVLITPPPINILDALSENLTEDELRKENELNKERRPYRTYMSKRRYAERIMEIAGEYEETGRVVGLDLWSQIVDAALEETGVGGRSEDKLPGSGLHGAREFGTGWFTDGLHLDKKAYHVLSKGLFETVTATWPGLAPDQLDSL